MIAVVSLLALGVVACGGDDADGASSASTAAPTTSSTASETTTTGAPAEGTLPSGATVTYPSSWTSWGAGFSGSLELGVPGTANVSVRDSAASEYLYGGLFGEADSLEGALSVMSAIFEMEGLAIGDAESAAVGGSEMLVAPVDNKGDEGLMAVMAFGDAYASLYVSSTGGPLPDDTATAALEVFSTLAP
jgi:hypothetical protein